MRSDFDKHADRVLCLFMVFLIILTTMTIWIGEKHLSENIMVDGVVVEKGHVPEFYYVSVKVDDVVYVIEGKNLYLDYDVGDRFNETLEKRGIHEL